MLGVLLAGTWVTSGRLEIGWLRFFSAGVFIATVVLSAWDLWLWRLPWFQRIPGVPRSVRGTWEGVLTSFWVDPGTGVKVLEKAAFLVVRQTASSVSVRLITDESQSRSSLASVSVPDGSAVLDYLYLNRPKSSVEHRSRMHHGSTVLDISGCPARRLEGRYWTDRDSRGELVFTKRSRRIADDFEEARELFTAS
ncbi:hypothetical protein EFK50_13200 [Nocardioides marmoriginsengisoli]|uniref:CD-NTase-associated protein 15 domain-containing protein n=2 Tax=Nocardioides marmoriginsengisoli TaxID=661483 RepID=A0A3N0CIC5_9ACTN|nr:hypothetical protein EFK50_13200 [Nocardioides marmoriginsengisoli]